MVGGIFVVDQLKTHETTTTQYVPYLVTKEVSSLQMTHGWYTTPDLIREPLVSAYFVSDRSVSSSKASFYLFIFVFDQVTVYGSGTFSQTVYHPQVIYWLTRSLRLTRSDPPHGWVDLSLPTTPSRLYRPPWTQDTVHPVSRDPVPLLIFHKRRLRTSYHRGTRVCPETPTVETSGATRETDGGRDMP